MPLPSLPAVDVAAPAEPSFAALGLAPNLLQALAELGFERPTPIQAQAVPLLLRNDRDFLGLAQTGTGKTAAFGLPLCQLIDTHSHQVQALVLAPTRELCVQITRDLMAFARHTPGLKVVAVYGGANIGPQIRAVQDGAQLVVATPGRFQDLYDRGVVDLRHVRWVALDEADEMLNMGFREAINQILSYTPKDKLTWLFSATMLPEVRRIADEYMHEPVEIQVGQRNAGAENIEHIYYVVQARDRYLALKRIVDYFPDIFGMIFCRTKMEAQEVAEMLIKDGYNADSLHGDLNQQQRDRVMGRFRNRSLQVLVATDVAARGIDVDSVTHVIHYNMPEDVESYTHRSGRTARAGRSGMSIAIITSKELGKVRQLERHLRRTFEQRPVPTGAEVCERKLFHLIHTVKDTQVNEGQIGRYLPEIYRSFEGLSREELLQHFVSYEFNQVLNYYANVPDLNTSHARSEGGAKGRVAPHNKLYINLGTKDGIDKVQLIDLISRTTGIDRGEIGRIVLKDIKAYFEVPHERLQEVMSAFEGMKHRGRRVKVDYAEEDGARATRADRPFRDRDERPSRDRAERPYHAEASYGGGDRPRRRAPRRD